MLFTRVLLIPASYNPCLPVYGDTTHRDLNFVFSITDQEDALTDEPKCQPNKAIDSFLVPSSQMYVPVCVTLNQSNPQVHFLHSSCPLAHGHNAYHSVSILHQSGM